MDRLQALRAVCFASKNHESLKSQQRLARNTTTIEDSSVTHLRSLFQTLVRALYPHLQLLKQRTGASDGSNYSPNKSLNQLLLNDGSIFGDDALPSPRQTLHEMDGRLSSLFGSGWFFEWPGGKRPLNSTWPWADVKPSLLVLWGVCWMFVVTPVLDIPGSSYQKGNQRQNQRSPLQQSPSNYFYPQSSGGRSPIVKRESFSHSSDWPAVTLAQSARGVYQAEASPLDSTAYTLFPSQPIAATNAHQYHQNQLGQADTRTAPGVMRNAGVRVTTNLTNLPPTHAHSGGLDGFLSTSTSTDQVPYAVGVDGNASGSSRNYPPHRASTSVAAPSNPQLPHDTSGFDPTFTNHQHQQRRYYDAPRHKPQQTPYQRSPASLTPLSAATSDSYYNFSPSADANAAMSLTYDTASRTFPNYPPMMHEQPPPEQDESEHQQLHRYPSPGPPQLENLYRPPGVDAANGMDMSELPHKEDSEGGSPGRSRPIPKPDRQVTKSEDGKFICTWAGCSEDVKSFSRKCEWSKHMDKHDRPYKCPADGCEKLPGFTYSGGLLRHQREVHNLHGGPRKQLNCPHINCKRHSGKGFSRQENLNEHLRRVHTDAGQIDNAGDETEDDGSERAGMKRKRGLGRADEVADMRAEIARLSAEAAVLRAENDELRRNADLQQQQQQQSTNDLMRQMAQLRSMVGVGQGQAPQALM